MRVTRIFKEFAQSEQFAGVLLIVCTLISLGIANSSFQNPYHHLLNFSIANQSIEYWINDGLMTLFFLLVGLELKRELLIGELSSLKNSLLPIFSAVGGMVVPVLLYTYFNVGTSSQSGAAIPMATDIAFALGILNLLGNRVPASLKIFLTALAVIDDLGAIVVIAIFYTNTLVWTKIIGALVILIILIVLHKLKVNKLLFYLLGGILMWYLMLHSGIHATITGVIVAFVIPYRKGENGNISHQLQHFLHKPVAYIVLPLFALANTAIHFESNLESVFTLNYAIGVFVGLVLGKPVGIFLFTYIACYFKICKLPTDIQWSSVFGVGILGGIGFTMSIFITLLSFEDLQIINNAKLIILLSSLTAAIVGLLFLNRNLKK